MKKILILNGSPRKKGNTSILEDYLTGFLLANHTVKSIRLYDFNIKPCIDCRACKNGELLCSLKDGMEDLYRLIDNSDVMIIGTPIYWFGLTAQTKLFLDRFRPYFVNKKLEGEKAALILSAGSGAGDCDLTIEMFKRSFKALEIEFLGVVTSEAYDIGDAYNDKDAMTNIEKIAAIIS